MKCLSLMVASVLILVTGCSKPTAEEYFAQAEQSYRRAQVTADTIRANQETAKLFQPAIDLYTRVLTEYPDNPLAGPALFMVATIRNNDMHEPQLAVDSYKRYVAFYPDGKQAALAMFLIGYLYHNDLQNLDSAAAAYRRFLERFPHHEMAMSAQFELNALGKSPEELLQEKVQANEKKQKVAVNKSPKPLTKK